MKERIWLSMMEYSVLKEKMKENECGWSNSARWGGGLTGKHTAKGIFNLLPSYGVSGNTFATHER
jgi:hypothetical protein